MGGRTVVSDDEDEIEEEEDGREQEERRVDLDERDEDEDAEDEEELGPDAYEEDGFVVDDVEEEEEEEEKESDEERHRKKKKKRRETEKNYELDEDDYELLQDNNIGFRRPQPGNKFKRLKKAGRDSEVEERSGFSDEEESDRNSRGGRRTDEEKIKHSLFGDDEGPPLEDIAEEQEQPEEEDEEIVDEDEMADFIVDEDDVDENGDRIRRKKVKKKKVRQAPGVSSSALQEAQDIFGDVDELLAMRRQGIAASDADGDAEKRLVDEFEPLILSEKYMMPKDDKIRETDIPERILLSEDITGDPPTDDERIVEESQWIQNQLFTAGVVPPQIAEMKVIKEKKIDKDDIGRVLTMLHVQKLDLPFIAMYRKELCLSLLKDSEDLSEGGEGTPRIRWHKLLWTVYNLDRKWLLLRKRKSGLLSYYNKRFNEEAQRIDDVTRLDLNKNIFMSICKVLENATSEREVDDVDAKFNLHFPPGEVEVDGTQFKRPRRKSRYSDCHKAGLWEVANKFGYSSEELGSYLMKEKTSSYLEDGKETPEEVATNFTCAMFKTPEDVLSGARLMAAVEIGCEPNVKKHVRSIFMDKAVVSTSPTQVGKSVIDDVYHELAGVKWLRDKPLSKFVDAQWLRIQKAEEEKLLEVTIRLPESDLDDLINDAKENYLSDYVSKSAQLWNEQREKILHDAFSNFILPSMVKEARALLTARAKSWLLMEYGGHLWSKVSVAPYQKKETSNDSEDESDLRVMACCWGPGKPSTTFVMLDSSGEVVDVLYAGSISVRSQAAAEKQRKQLDQQRLLKFMTDHQPHVVCLGTANLSCRPLKDDIYEVIFRIVEDHPRDVSQDMNISIVYGDESLPRLYESSRVSKDQLPNQSDIVKRAVGLGRYLQNPLAMIATLCGPGKEILSWKLCPLEHFLTDDEKFDMVEQVMVEATNQVGLDINVAASHEWLFAPLQFISGLGPRKAYALQRAFVRAGSISNRKEIPMGKILRKKVFINAVGFLRVRRSGAAAASSQIMDLLDDTRIHPESYELAKTLAKDVRAEDFEHGPDEMDDDDQEMAIEHVRDKPEMLQALDINAYHESKFEELGTRKLETFHLIKMELLHGFQDWRFPFMEPSPDEEFSMLSGESDDSLSEGKIVQVTVRQVQDNRVVCMFDSGLKGIISSEDFSDDGYDPEKVEEGDMLSCKIKSVNKQRFIVNLTSKGSELSRIPRFLRNYDPYFREDEVNIHSEQEKARREKELAKKHFKPRMIVHPRFQNLTAEEAKQFLSDKDAGESIVRPSSKGPSYLTLTIKIYDDVYAHKDIVESGKDHKDITSLLCLGKTLTIDQETFEDLDEVMDRYVDPLVGHLKNMLGYRKFRKGNKGQVDELLKAEKAANPNMIVYCFGISHEHPGTFILTYIRNSNPHHEYIGLYPKGFKFRKKDYEDIDRLVAHFQRNIDKPPDSGPSLRTVAAMVPMKSPAAWGSSGEGSVGGYVGSNGGWRGQANSDRERPSVPGSRSGGRSDYRNNYSSENRDSHPSGLPRPGRGGRGQGGRGRGRGRDSDFGSSPRWAGSGSRNEDGGLSSFPGAKVQNSPGRERFPGSWGGGGGGAAAAAASTWGTGNITEGGSSWGSSGGAAGGRGGAGSWKSWGSNDGSGFSGGRSGNDGPSWGGAGRESGDWGRSSGSGGSRWGEGNPEATRGQGGSDPGLGNSEWGAGSNRLVPPQVDGGKGWSSAGGGGGAW